MRSRGWGEETAPTGIIKPPEHKHTIFKTEYRSVNIFVSFHPSLDDKMRPKSMKIRKKIFSFIILFERKDAPQNRKKIIIRNTRKKMKTIMEIEDFDLG